MNYIYCPAYRYLTEEQKKHLLSVFQLKNARIRFDFREITLLAVSIFFYKMLSIIKIVFNGRVEKFFGAQNLSNLTNNCKASDYRTELTKHRLQYLLHCGRPNVNFIFLDVGRTPFCEGYVKWSKKGNEKIQDTPPCAHDPAHLFASVFTFLLITWHAISE